MKRTSLLKLLLKLSLCFVFLTGQAQYAIQREWGSASLGLFQLKNPQAILSTPDGSFYVSDQNALYKFTSTGDLIGQRSDISYATSLDLDTYGNVVATTYNQVIRLTPSLITINSISNNGIGDGQLNNVQETAVDSANNIYVLDQLPGTAPSNGPWRVQVFSSDGTFIRNFVTLDAGYYSDNSNYLFRQVGNLTIGNGSLYLTNYSYGPGTETTANILEYSLDGVLISSIGSYGFDNGQFSWFTGLTVSSSGNLLVVEYNRISIFNSSGTYLSTINYQGGNDLSMESNGNILIINSSGSLHRIDQAGNILATIGEANQPGQFRNPFGVAMDSFGNMFVLDTENNRVQKFNASGDFVSQFGGFGSGDDQLNYPRRMHISRSNDIYIIDGSPRVKKFDNNGNFISAFGTYGTGDGQFVAILDIKTDSAGMVNVVDYDGYSIARVQRFTPTGQFISKWGSYGDGDDQLYYPQCLAIDSKNNFYIVSNTSSSGFKVKKFTAEGQYLSAVISPYFSHMEVDQFDNIYGNMGNSIVRLNDEGIPTPIYSNSDNSFFSVGFYLSPTTETLLITDFGGNMPSRVFKLTCPLPLVNFSVPSTPSGSTASFIDMSTNISPSADYRWDFGDGIEDFTKGDVQHTYTSLGQYTSSLSITQGCFNRKQQTLSIIDNDGDNDGFTSLIDCNDNDVSVFPNAPELCDGKDNDCDGTIDDGCASTMLWGLTTQGGYGGGGTIFSMSADGSNGTQVQYSFEQNLRNPNTNSLLELPDGSKIGMTYAGGNGYGGIFKILPDGTYSTILRFNQVNGAYPFGSLIQGTDGALYGMTGQGGPANNGTIFKINPDGSGHVILHSFNYSQGGSPYGSLVQGVDGALYGMTVYGGSYGIGTVFKINPDGSGFSVLHNFDGTSGSQPFGSLIQGTDGVLYGMTFLGGTSDAGTVFKINVDGSGHSVLFNFNDSNGSRPRGSLVQGIDGSLYGMTLEGGSNYSGTVFKINNDGTGHSILYNFNYSNGANPYGSLIQGTDGSFYGMTARGGSSGGGTIFKFNSDGTGYSILLNFNNSNGADPQSTLIEGTDGVLYGMTFSDGSADAGTVFKINTDGSGHSILHIFNSSTGIIPYGALIQGVDKRMYGMTNLGGSVGRGTIFRISADGSGYAILHNFNTANGANPYGSLIQGTNGALYGMTSQGGLSGFGTVFKINADGSEYTVLHNFNYNNGGYPYGSLILGTDGALYGMTSQGGSSNYGTVFRINLDGSGHTVLFNFNDSNGSYPYGSLIQGPDGALYGMTNGGGAAGEGTIFKINADGSSHTILQNFNNTNGARPFGSLIQPTDGALYGITERGGSSSMGVLFKIDTDGSGYSVLNNFNGFNGIFPSSSLTFYKNKLFGYTDNGGLYYNGTIFNFDLTTSTFNKLVDLSSATGQYPKYGSLLLVEPKNIDPPTTPASDIVFSNVTNHSMTISVIPGNGEKRVILMKDYGNASLPPIAESVLPVGAGPVSIFDGTELNGNLDFSVAEEYQPGWKVLYAGNDSTIQVTGLEANHSYRVTVLEYNGSGMETRYLNANPPVSQTTTLPNIAAPTISSSNITFSNVLSSSLQVNFTPGNGQQRLAVIKPGSAPSFIPADDTMYWENLGNGTTVVYVGIDSSFTVTGLLPSTNYFVTIFEFNSDSISTKYLVAGAPVASQITLALPNVYVTTPVNGAINQNASLNVTARAVTGATVYTIELSVDSTFNSTKVRSGSRTQLFDSLQYNTLYYTRVKTDLRDDYGQVTTFTTRPAESLAYVITPANSALNTNTVLNITSNTVLYASSYTIQLSESPGFDTVAFEVTGPTRTLAFTGLKYNTTYYNRVRTNLSSEFGQVRSFTTRVASGLAYVTSPTNGAVNVNNATLNITSNSVPGASTYRIQLSETSYFDSVAFDVSGTTRTLAFSGLKYNTTYYNRVLTDVSEDYGQVRSFSTRTAESISYVTSPANNATNVATVLNITANTVPGAASYTIQLSESATFDTVAFEITGATRSLAFSGLKYNTIYYNRVRTDMASGFGQVRSFTTRTAESISYVTSPGNGAVNINPSVTIYANTVPGAATYTIQLSETSDFATIHFEATGATRSLPFAGLKYGTTYYNRVITNLTSNYGQVRSFTTRTLESYAYVTSPGNGATNVNTSLNVTSNTVPGASSYTIQLSTLSDFSVINFESTGTRTRSFTGLLTGTTYYNRVFTNVTTVPGPVRIFTTLGTPPAGRIATKSVSATEKPSISEFKVHQYPNPIQERFWIVIESSKYEEAEVQLVDMMGRSIHQSVEHTNTEVEIASEMTKGLYLLKVKAGAYLEVIRVTKE
jgi:uncharacterized repeat protein (TIGR03803 family)